MDTQQETITGYQIFVGGCHPSTREEDITTYFSQFGEILDIKMMKDKITKNFRGFCFLTFKEEAAWKSALVKPTHLFLNKKVEVKEALTKEQSRIKLLDEKKRKVFLENLSRDINPDRVKEYFACYGEIEDVRVIIEKKKTREKVIGFVLFKQLSSVDKVFEKGNMHYLVGIEVLCKRAMLREELKQEQIKTAKMLRELNKDKIKQKKKEKKQRRKERKRLEKEKRLKEMAMAEIDEHQSSDKRKSSQKSDDFDEIPNEDVKPLARKIPIFPFAGQFAEMRSKANNQSKKYESILVPGSTLRPLSGFGVLRNIADRTHSEFTHGTKQFGSLLLIEKGSKNRSDMIPATNDYSVDCEVDESYLEEIEEDIKKQKTLYGAHR